MRIKYVVRKKNNGRALCGLRYDEKTGEFLIGGSKSRSEEITEIIKLMDLRGKQGDGLDVEVDGYKMRMQCVMFKRDWKEFIQRLGRLYDIEEVKSFRRLMR